MSGNCKQTPELLLDLHSSLDLTAAERVDAIGAFCRRIVNHPESEPAVSAAAWQCLREMPELTDASLRRLLLSLENPGG